MSIFGLVSVFHCRFIPYMKGSPFFSLLFYSLPFPFRLHSCFPFSPSLLYSHLFLPLPSYSLLFFSLLIYSIRLSSLLVSSILFLPPHLFSLHFPSLSLSSPLLISLSSLLLSSLLSFLLSYILLSILFLTLSLFPGSSYQWRPHPKPIRDS